MPNPTGVPVFGGYFTRRVGVNMEHVYAWWADGSLAYWVDGTWFPLDAPSFASLFPDRVTREPEPMPTGVWIPWADPKAPTATGITCQWAEPAQPRPDDADPLEYPSARGGRDD